MRLLRRFLSLFALLFWLGGFMFYGAVVVPIVRANVVDPNPGVITQKVTQWMNLAGTLAVLVVFVELWAGQEFLKRWRWIAWLGMALPQPILVWMHHEMSRQMLAPDFFRSDLSSFLSQWHRPYLLLNTIQWAAGMAFIGLSLKVWRAEDQALQAAVRYGAAEKL
jgi:hypothetical protein